MYGYLGQIFDTFEQFLQYLNTTYGSGAQAQLQSITQWGQDLGGNPLFINGVQQYGSIGNGLIEAGYESAQVYLNGTASATSQTVIEPSYTQLAEYLRQASINYGGVDMTNVQITVGETIDNVAQTIPGLNQSMVSGNGTASNIPSLVTAEETAGTGGFLGTLATVGYVNLPTIVAAAAPLLGVGIGYGLYETNPDFWTAISRKVAPYVWKKSDDIADWLVHIAVKAENDLYTAFLSEDFLQALREGFIEQGVYSVGPDTPVQPSSLPQLYFFDNGTRTNFTLANYTNAYNSDWKVCSASDIKMYFNNALHQGLTVVRNDTNEEVPILYCLISANTTGKVKITPVFDSSYAGWTGYIRLNLKCGGAQYNWAEHKWEWFNTENTSTNAKYMISFASATNDDYSYNGLSIPSSSMNNVMAYALNVFSVGGGAGVEGTTIESGATYPTDTTQNLAEIYPSWASNGISVITNPLADNMADGTTKYYPFSLSDTVNTSNPNNVSSTKTQAQAQQAQNTDPAQINQIADAIRDLIDELTDDGTLPPDPTVPSNPSGNTPTPTPPVITGAGSDLIAIYNPTKAEVQAFNAFLWSLDTTQLVNWKKVIANPIDAIISFAMIYVTPTTGTPQHIKCGYIETDVSSKVVTNQYVDIDCGTVQISEYFHNVWDYEATRISIYLPFIGIVPLHVGDVMDSTIRVRYRVDVYTGTCLAQIIVLKGNSLATLYTYTGNCSVQLPLTSGSFSGVFSTLLSMVSTALTGNLVGAAGVGIGSALTGRIQQDIQRSGNIGSNAGAMGIRTPYVIITRNVPLDAYLYQNQYGFPANKTVTLGDMRGYTRVKTIHLSGISCTDDELEEIERLLKEGVIIN